MSHSRQLFLPPITLDRQGPFPLHRQIARQVAQAIRGGAPTGARLPSSRVFARLLGVSRNTVLVAYDELAAEGLVDGKRGAAMVVSGTRAAGVPDVHRLLRDAQYPARTLQVADPDGAVIDLNYFS